MKKIIFLIITIFSIFSCTPKAEKTVEYFLINVKEQNIKKAMKVSENPELVKNLEHKFNNKLLESFFDNLHKNFKFKILNSAAGDDKSVIVNVEIENIDVQDLLFKVFQKSIKKAFYGELKIDIEKEIISIIKEGDVKRIKIVDQYVVVNKKVRVSSKNIDNIFGTYYSSISNLSNLGK